VLNGGPDGVGLAGRVGVAAAYSHLKSQAGHPLLSIVAAGEAGEGGPVKSWSSSLTLAPGAAAARAASGQPPTLKFLKASTGSVAGRA
jgi:hypothetical protein